MTKATTFASSKAPHTRVGASRDLPRDLSRDLSLIIPDTDEMKSEEPAPDHLFQIQTLDISPGKLSYGSNPYPDFQVDLVEKNDLATPDFPRSICNFSNSTSCLNTPELSRAGCVDTPDFLRERCETVTTDYCLGERLACCSAVVVEEDHAYRFA